MREIEYKKWPGIYLSLLTTSYVVFIHTVKRPTVSKTKPFQVFREHWINIHHCVFQFFEKFLFWSTILNFFVQIMNNFLVNFNLLFQFEPLFFDWKIILKIPKHCSWSVDSMRYHFYGNQITNEEDNNILLQVFSVHFCVMIFASPLKVLIFPQGTLRI